jgi:hypothetical protein
VKQGTGQSCPYAENARVDTCVNSVWPVGGLLPCQRISI